MDNMIFNKAITFPTTIEIGGNLLHQTVWLHIEINKKWYLEVGRIEQRPKPEVTVHKFIFRYGKNR